jgi:hypothetical protein
VPRAPDRYGARDKFLETIYTLTEIHAGRPISNFLFQNFDFKPY